MASLSKYIAAMPQDENDYFALLGTRVAQWRKASHEVGRRRISALPKARQKFVIQAPASVLAQASMQAAAR